MGNVSFGVGIVNMRNDVKKSAMASALEKSIISAHERYFHGSPGKLKHIVSTCIREEQEGQQNHNNMPAPFYG